MGLFPNLKPIRGSPTKVTQGKVLVCMNLPKNPHLKFQSSSKVFCLNMILHPKLLHQPLQQNMNHKLPNISPIVSILICMILLPKPILSLICTVLQSEEQLIIILL